jgi:hypothetical protein
MPRKPLAIIFALAVVVGACSLAAPAPSATTGGGGQGTPPASAQAAPSASPLPSPASPSAEPSANPPASGSSTGGAQLDCQKLLTAAEAGQALGLPDVTFDADNSQNGVVGSSVAICSYVSGGLPVVTLQINPAGFGDPYRIGKVGAFKEVQPRDVSGLGGPAKLWVTNDSAGLVVVGRLSTLQVGAVRLGMGPQAADAVVAIAKLVLPRLPGG